MNLRVDLKKRNWDLDDEIIGSTLISHKHPEKREVTDSVMQCPQCCHTHFTQRCSTIIGTTGKQCQCPAPTTSALPPSYL